MWWSGVPPILKLQSWVSQKNGTRREGQILALRKPILLPGRNNLRSNQSHACRHWAIRWDVSANFNKSKSIEGAAAGKLLQVSNFSSGKLWPRMHASKQGTVGKSCGKAPIVAWVGRKCNAYASAGSRSLVMPEKVMNDWHYQRPISARKGGNKLPTTRKSREESVGLNLSLCKLIQTQAFTV